MDGVATVLLDCMKRLGATSMVLSNRASYIKMVRSIIKHVDPQHHKRLFSVPFLAFDYAPCLDVQDCMELLEYSLLQTARTSIFTGLPAAKYMSPDQVYTLMQLCMQKPRTPSPTPDFDDVYDGYGHDGCSSCGHMLEDPLPPQWCQHAAADLAELPSAARLSVLQLASLIEKCLTHEDGPRPRVLSALLELPAAQHFDLEVAQGLLSTAFHECSMDAVNLLCQCLPACATACECLDPQLVLQRLEALLHSSEVQFRAVLWHPRLQQQVSQTLPQPLL